MNIKYAVISKAGKRQDNEDAYKIIEMPEKSRWSGIICDGMGGHAMGEVASQTVVDTISNFWNASADRPDEESKIKEACLKASKAIDERSNVLRSCQMGTTMVMASIENNRVTIAHIGDSRCYVFRKGHYDYDDITNTNKDHVVYQTKDHVRLDFGWEVMEKCFFSYHPEQAEPDIVHFEIMPGDRILICSDGVYKCIAPEILKTVTMEEDKEPDEILDVIDWLCDRQGDDNYTAILAKIE